jgi:hypothetical protein
VSNSRLILVELDVEFVAVEVDRKIGVPWVGLRSSSRATLSPDESERFARKGVNGKSEIPLFQPSSDEETGHSEHDESWTQRHEYWVDRAGPGPYGLDDPDSNGNPRQ